jgi:CRP-like cAMP-binding protein
MPPKPAAPVRCPPAHRARCRTEQPAWDDKLAVLTSLGRSGAVGLPSDFDGVPTCELRRLAETLTLTSARPGQYLEVQDTPARWWSLIVSGHALVERNGRPISLLTRGDSWTERTIDEEVPAPHSVVALTPVTVLTMDRCQFFGLPDRDPTLTWGIQRCR